MNEKKSVSRSPGRASAIAVSVLLVITLIVNLVCIPPSTPLWPPI